MRAFWKWFAGGLALPLIGAAAIAGVAVGQPAVEWNTDRLGSDIELIELARGQDHQVCAQACVNNRACRAWTWVPTGAQRAEGPNCWLKDATPEPSQLSGVVSGLRGAGLPGRTGPAAASLSTGGSVERNTDRPGSDIAMIELRRDQDHRVCAQACAENRACRAWTWVPTGAQRAEGPNCWLKDATPDPVRNAGMVSGLRGGASH